jgi:hypothetical protein
MPASPAHAGARARPCGARRPSAGRTRCSAQQEQELVAQNLSGRAHFAAEAVALAQEARLAIGAAVAEGRKRQRHGSDAIEMRGEFGDVAAVRPDHADRPVMLGEVIAVGEEARRRHHHCTARRNGRAVLDPDEAILDRAAVPNEWHRRAP